MVGRVTTAPPLPYEVLAVLAWTWGVSGDLAYAGSGGAERGGSAVQLAGGIGQDLLEPVARGLGLLGAGAVARRGRAPEFSAQRSTGTQLRRIQRRGEHRTRIRVGVLPAGDQLRRGRQRLVRPYRVTCSSGRKMMPPA
jgi:hypothetical protein